MSTTFEKICRTCMAESSTMLPLWPTSRTNTSSASTKQQERSCVVSMLESCTNLSVSELDGLPQNICLNCIREINQAYSFKQKCERSEQTLLSLLKLSNVKQKEVVTENECPPNNEVNDKQIILEFTEEVVDDNESLSQRHSHGLATNRDAGTDEAINKTLYQCLNCCSIFYSNSELEKHQLIYCKLCKMYYEHTDNRIHKQNHDYYEETVLTKDDEQQTLFHCEKCALYFLQEEIYIEHCKIHEKDLAANNDNVNVEAPIIQHQSDGGNQYAAIRELVTNEDVEIVETNIANIEPISVAEQITIGETYQEDSAVHEQSSNKQLKCSICNGQFVNEKSLMIHFNSKKCMQPSFQCDSCNRVFAKKKFLLKHIISTHQGPDVNKEETTVQSGKHQKMDKRKYKCKSCPKAFTMLSVLKDHLRIHSGERPFLCSTCGKGFSQNTNMKQHLMRHNQTKPFKCKICKKSFVSKGELTAHDRKHTGEHPFKCESCNSGFTTSSSLVKHRRIHTGERPYACDYCPMRFTALSTLKNHRRTHTGERPFRCNLCERTFAQRSDCVSHIRTHTGERPYSCDKCDMKFLLSTALRSHLKRHHDESIF